MLASPRDRAQCTLRLPWADWGNRYICATDRENHFYMQRTLILIGLVLVVIGLAWPWLGKLPLGRLPGDIVVDRASFKLYVPITTMILLSAVLSLLLWLFRR